MKVSIKTFIFIIECLFNSAVDATWLKIDIIRMSMFSNAPGYETKVKYLKNMSSI